MGHVSLSFAFFLALLLAGAAVSPLPGETRSRHVVIPRPQPGPSSLPELPGIVEELDACVQIGLNLCRGTRLLCGAREDAARAVRDVV
jgi:hypothetical protein